MNRMENRILTLAQLHPDNPVQLGCIGHQICRLSSQLTLQSLPSDNQEPGSSWQIRLQMRIGICVTH